MLFKIDSLYGHVIEDTPAGPVYQDDKSLVDDANPRPCLGCKVEIKGGQDPCIANLPEVYQACCGHGLERSATHDGLNGYAAFKDGRCIRFSGTVGGTRIRAAVSAVLAQQPLPEGFAFDEERPWWTGLTDGQRQYVQSNIPNALAKSVLKLTGAPASTAHLRGEQPWWDGLSEEHKAAVWANMRSMLAELVQESLAHESLLQ